MQRKFSGLVCACGLAAAACGDAPGSGQGEEVGSLRAGVEVSDNQHDVTGFRFDVVAADQGCDAEPLATQVVEVEAEAAPGSVAGSGSHPFGSGLFVLAPGEYRVCATPLAGEGPSAECAATDAVAEVSSSTTSEVVLFSQCGGEQNGGLGAVVALNDRPQIDTIELDPSTYISICESVNLVASASDPNEDELSYSWSVTSGPEGASLRADGSQATFSGSAGDYTLELSVDDGHGGTASLTFPVHVSAAVCEVPEEVQAIFTARCAPCHTSASAGGLRLTPESVSYAALVGTPASAAACAERVRVVPGDSAASYLIAKLHGETGICGAPMPRNLPALPEAEIATIEAWINDLPH